MPTNTNDNSPPPRVAIWAAVSSKPQAAEEKASLQQQEAAGRKFAQAIGGHVVAVYTVPGHSRDLIFWEDAEAAMPAYRRLRQDCEALAFDILWARDPDRLGRDAALSNQVISLVEKVGQAEVYLASAPHPIGHASIGKRYTYAIQSIRAQEDQQTRTRLMKMGLRARVRRGLPANHWPTGYIPIRDARGETIGGALDPETAPAVRLATRLFLDGKPYSHIVDALNHSSYRPRRAANWAYSTVRAILNNDTYAGYPSWGDESAAEPSDAYPALWDADTYHAILRERARRYKPQNRTAQGPFCGLCFCARCGGVMTRHLHPNGRTYSLRCSTHNRKSITGQPCHANYIPESEIAQRITTYLQNLTTPAALDAALATDDHRPALQDDIARVTARLQDLTQQRERLALTLAAGQIDPQIYRAADDKLLDDTAALQDDLARISAALDAAPDLDQRRAALQALIPIFPTLIDRAPPDRIRTLLQNAGLRIECEAGAITNITIKP